MNDFNIKTGVKSYSGGVGGVANSIEPGKRMLSSMSPTIVLKEGKLFMVVGTPGGYNHTNFGFSGNSRSG